MRGHHVSRSRRIEVPIADALAAYFYDLQTSDPWPHQVRPKAAAGGEFEVTRLDTDFKTQVLSVLSIERTAERTEIAFRSHSSEGSIRGSVGFERADDDLTMVTFNADVDPASEADFAAGGDLTTEVEELLNRLQAVAGQLGSGRNQLDGERVVRSRNLVAMLEGRRVPDLSL